MISANFSVVDYEGCRKRKEEMKSQLSKPRLAGKIQRCMFMVGKIKWNLNNQSKVRKSSQSWVLEHDLAVAVEER